MTGFKRRGEVCDGNIMIYLNNYSEFRHNLDNE